MLLPALLGLLASTDAVYLSHEVRLDCLHPDSGYTETTLERIVPLTARGVERYRTLIVSYRSTWETVEILEAEVRHWRSGRGDDEAVVTDSPHGTLLPGDRLESSYRMLEIAFPGVEIGDTLFLTVERRIDRLPMGNYYAYTFIPAGRDSVHRSSLTVDWPSDREMHVSGSLGDGEILGETDSSRTVRWLPGASPAYPSLPFTADLSHRAPSVTIASHSPAEVGAGLWRILDEPCTVGPDNLADSILASVGSDPVVLSAWISREVEYIGGDWGLDPGYSPRTPLETLEERAGVCRDRAVLLVWLLRRAGFDAALALTSSSGDIGGLVGSRSFDHMLVLIDGGGETPVFLDPTLATSADGFGYGLRGARYLPLTSAGSPLGTFPEDPGSADLMEISARVTHLPEAGVLSGRIRVAFSGSADELFRSMLLGVQPASRSELMRTLLGALEGSFEAAGELSDPSSGLVVEGEGSWRLIDAGGGALVLPGLETFDVVGNRAAAYLLPPVITAPFIETPYGATLRLEVAGIDPLPAELPDPLVRGSFRSTMSLSGDTLILEEVSTLLPIRPSQGELHDLRLAMLARLSATPRTLAP